MPLIAIFTMPMIAFSGALATAFRPSKIPPKISFTPVHARSQLPVNTPRMKSMIPSKTILMLSQMFFTFAKKAFSTSPRTGPKIFVQSVAKTPCKKSSTPCSTAWIWSPNKAIAAIIAAAAAKIAIGTMPTVVTKPVIAGMTVPVITPTTVPTAVIILPTPLTILPITTTAGPMAATTAPITRMICFWLSSRLVNHAENSCNFTTIWSIIGASVAIMVSPNSAPAIFKLFSATFALSGGSSVALKVSSTVVA